MDLPEREVRLWMREDGGAPKALGEGQRPPGPGRVVAIRAGSREEALAALALRAKLERTHGDEPMTPGLVAALARQASADRDRLRVIALVGIREVATSEMTAPYGARG